jgi:tRNA-intron endonuclease
MDGHVRDDGVVEVGDDARQRFYDSRGYGRPLSGNRLELAPVEAAHLLWRGDLDAVDGMGFGTFLTEVADLLPFVVYRDLRERGFYLSPAREGWFADPRTAEGSDLVVFPRGRGPWDGDVEYRIRVCGEREAVPAESIGDVTLAVVDEEGELTYLDTARATPGGDADPSTVDLPEGVEASLAADRVIAWNPPTALYEDAFFGQRLGGRTAEGGPLQLSLVEAAYLSRRGVIDVDEAAVVDRGREVEGDRFDRRLRAYAAMRTAGSVPKSGFKFGADFRSYDSFGGIDDMGHSDRLVRVVPADHTFFPRDLSLDVRLAGGVRKRMVFALTDATHGIDWLSVGRLTP